MNIGLISTSASDCGFTSKLFYFLDEQGIDIKLLLTGQHCDANSSERGSLSERYFNVNESQRNITINKRNEADRTEHHAYYTSMDINQWIKQNRMRRIIISGDRYEMLIAATIASQYENMKLIHYGAGQVSEGSKDHQYRKCISVLSDYYIVSTINSKRNLERELGEINGYKVCISGSIGLDRLKKYDNHDFIKTGQVLLCIHPQMHGNDELISETIELLMEAKALLQEKMKLLVSRINNDMRSSELYETLLENINSVGIAYEELLQPDDAHYISLLKTSELIIGNSSSFVIEAPSLSKASLIVGNRQEGRESARCVIRINKGDTDKAKKLKLCLDINRGRYTNEIFENPYWQGGACKQISEFLKKIT